MMNRRSRSRLAVSFFILLACSLQAAQPKIRIQKLTVSPAVKALPLIPWVKAGDLSWQVDDPTFEVVGETEAATPKA